MQILTFVALISEFVDSFSIIILSETWIFDNEIVFYNIDGFDAHFCCRNYNRSGGIVVFTKRSLNFSPIDSNFVTAEALILRSSLLNLTILAIYRSHDFSIECFNSELQQILVDLKVSNIVLMGDLNIDILSDDYIVHDYLSCLSEFGFYNCLNKPTRISLTCLDHIFVKTKNISVSTRVYVSGITDHFVTLCRLSSDNNLSVNTDATLTCSKINYKKLFEFLNTYTFKYNNLDSLEQQYQSLVFKINNIKNNFKYNFRSVKPTRNNWMTDDIIILIKQKEKLYKKCESTLMILFIKLHIKV